MTVFASCVKMKGKAFAYSGYGHLEKIMSLLLIVLNCLGLFAVGLCFFFWMPVWGQLLSILFSAIIGEQKLAKRNGVESGSKLIDPNQLEELQ